jgi:hypothetical protein
MLTGQLRSEIKRRLPKQFLRWYKRRKWEPIRKQYAALDVADAFSEIYRTKLWGGPEGQDFFSGGGSGLLFSKPYVDRVVGFIADHQIRTFVDLGCGDFQVGRQVCAASGVRYVGVDVVPDLIAYNQSHFGGPLIEFRRANLIEDELPDGEFCVIRQVLQHLSNAQIHRVLEKCKKYRYVWVTEGVYVGPGSRPNLDIPHGPDIRATFNSGLFLDLPPFSLKTTPILEIESPDDDTLIRTVQLETGTDSVRGD